MIGGFMDVEFLLKAFALIAALTALTVEGIKKLLDSVKKTYNSTILAVIVSIVLSVVVSVGYMIYNSIGFSAQTAIEIVVLAFLSFLGATVGYDKVIKEIFKKDN